MRGQAVTKQRTKQAIGRQNRARGQAFERLVAKELAKVWPEARRNLSQTRTAKKEGGDILGTPHFWECKSGQWSLSADLAKARVEAADHGQVAHIVYRDGHRLMVYCRAHIGMAQPGRPSVPIHVALDHYLAAVGP